MFVDNDVPAIGTGAIFGPGTAGVLAKGTDFAPILISGSIAVVLSCSLFIMAHLTALAQAQDRVGNSPIMLIGLPGGTRRE
ncbi:MAG: hypothetical protein ACR2P1_10420 [Pseudomonadales bacterium]